MPELSTSVFVGFFAVLLVLWRIVEHLKAIRTSLADIAKAARDEAAREGGAYYLQKIMTSVEKTETLLERAVRKRWGNAIDSLKWR